MYSKEFNYFRPSSVAETIGILQQNEGARLLAGGHSLLPAMKLRLSSPSALVDLGMIDELKGIEEQSDTLRIGAMTTHAEIASSPLVMENCRALLETAAGIGDAQVRNRGTIGGSLAHADPAADYPTLLLALSARVDATGPNGTREIEMVDFSTDLFTTALGPAEVLAAVHVPRLSEGQGAVYLKHHHPASRYAVVGVAAVVAVSGEAVTDVRVAVGGVTPYPVRCSEVETALAGREPGEETLRDAAKMVNQAIQNPIGDHYASPEFRAHLAEVMTRRALRSAVERALS